VADHEEARNEYNISITGIERLKPATAVVVAVAHQAYQRLSPEELFGLMGENPVVIDVKGIYNPQALKKVGIKVWRL